MARPVWTPTDAQRRQAETMAAYGIPEVDIARVLGVSKPTLRKHCGTELDTGATRANSKVAERGDPAKCARVSSSRWFIALIEEAEKLWPHSSSVIAITFRVDTPCTYISASAATSARSER